METPNKIVKIVHGSTVFWKPKKQQISWIFKLSQYFKDKGIRADSFVWSGFPLDAFSEKTIDRFIGELLKIVPKEDHELYIFAKSLGAEIVEAALKKLEKEKNPLVCKIFIRMASPDADYHNNVGKLVDIFTEKDFLNSMGTILVRKIYKDRPKAKNIVKLDFGKLTHKALNENIIIPSGKYRGRHVYDVYYDLINQ